MVVKFPKALIYENKNKLLQIIKIVSTQRKKSLKWHFKTFEEFDDEGIFNIIDKEGEITPSQELFANIQFSFTPKEKKEYKAQVTLVVIDSDGIKINNNKIRRWRFITWNIFW